MTAERVDAAVLPLLCAVCFVSMAAMRACDSLLPGLAREFDTGMAGAAQSIGAFAIAYGLAQLVLGPLSDRYGRLPVMVGAVLLSALANVGVALAASLAALVGWRALAGAAAGGIVPLAITLIGDLVAYQRRQEVLAQLSLATISGMVAGQWLGGVVADAWGWRALFIALAAAFGLALWPLLAQARRAGPAVASGTGGTGGSLAGLGPMLRQPWVRLVLGITALEGVFAFAALALVPSYLHQTFELSQGQAGAVMSLYGLGGLVFAANARHLIRGLGEPGMALAGSSLVGLGMLVLMLAPAWAWALPACAVAGVGFYMLHSTLQTLATQMHPAQRGLAISAFVVCLFGGQSLGIAVAAPVVDALSARWVFAASALALPLLGLWLARRLRQHPR